MWISRGIGNVPVPIRSVPCACGWFTCYMYVRMAYMLEPPKVLRKKWCPRDYQLPKSSPTSRPAAESLQKKVVTKPKGFSQMHPYTVDHRRHNILVLWIQIAIGLFSKWLTSFGSKFHLLDLPELFLATTVQIHMYMYTYIYGARNNPKWAVVSGS